MMMSGACSPRSGSTAFIVVRDRIKKRMTSARGTPTIQISRVRLPVTCLGSSCWRFERYLKEMWLVRTTTRSRMAEAAIMNSTINCLMRAACGEAASKTEDACISKNRCPIIKYKYYISHTFYVEWDSVYGLTFLENP